MIEVTKSEGLLVVVSPFNREFVSFARMRGGKWSDGEKAWIFDIQDEFAIRSTLIDIYGTDDYESCVKVDVRVKLDHFDIQYEEEFFLFGRQLLRRKYADRLDVDTGVITVQGGYDEYSKRRYLMPEEGTIIEVRGVPRDIALQTWSENKEAIELLGSVDLKIMQEEKESLLKRIEQIDKMILELQEESEVDDLADLYD